MNQNLTEKIRNDFDRLALYDVEQWNHNNHYHQFLVTSSRLSLLRTLRAGFHYRALDLALPLPKDRLRHLSTTKLPDSTT